MLTGGGREGRINFPKLGPIMVAGLSFDGARVSIEQHVSQQLIGTRVSVTMGNLRSIRVFVLGEAQRPGALYGERALKHDQCVVR